MLNNIKEVVKEKGLKNTWIAEQLGVNACDISHWCSGHRKTNQDKLKSFDLPVMSACPLTTILPR